ncbi:serine/threonine protein kinase [Saprolegnia diclina VS20]|uniref:Serine/threonine protein kinase n=1 Tax=Saprolegnia diclina (strain VS20) TaxID=1156394 RepID=T0PS73_SAPDV|nr:serine/threonine protein kinase [Saprolegnia diclina VS20]EQC28344.1 serine/threonine protein kinase [Saprolegnia diclina VS20]|eukprot:XP_008618214.1 serine/threonine protein kinase [Saprolegnia diclina VS20]
MDDYVVDSVLAPALYGDILLCSDLRAKEQVVIKKMDQRAAASHRTLVRSRHVLENATFEKHVNQVLRTEGGHRNVLILRDEFVEDGYDHFVFDYCSQGALFDVMESVPAKTFTRHEAEMYFAQVLAGLKFIHAAGFAHRDLSLENILVDEHNVAKICDFGLAVDINARPNERVGKPYYIAPEVFDNIAPYDPVKADIWSLGVVLFLLLTGVPLFNVPSKLDESYAYMKRHGLRRLIYVWDLDDFVPEEARDLLEKMLCINPAKRCSLQDVLQHPYVLKLL